MNVIGLFRELEPHAVATLVSLREARGLLPAEFVGPVLEHLAKGVPVVDVMEASSDPLDGRTVISGGASLECDGAWVWRNDLRHFVSKYQVGLPDAFVEHVLASQGDPPPDTARVVTLWKEAQDAYRAALKGTL